MVTNQELLTKFIYPNTQLDYYYSYDFSPEFYIKLAKAGFISTAAIHKKEPILLPEMQLSYALLDFKDLHISKKVKSLLNKNEYKFSIKKSTKKVIENINSYHKQSWLISEYVQMLKELELYQDDNFELISIQLHHKETNKLIAGEIGYKIGKTYTSLSGFFNREKAYNNWGKLQLVLLARYLQEQDYDFWNLGHACLQYKLDLGAKVYDRDEFLNRWFTSIKDDM